MKKYLAEFFNKINHFTGETKAKQQWKSEKKKREKRMERQQWNLDYGNAIIISLWLPKLELYDLS